jgi:predicted metalloprotease with PDZ domain
MFRGGLSGPNSLFIHSDRPLISANNTSTLLHELMHVAQGYSAGSGDDWIVEGIAEFYTLAIMQRSGTISTTRYRKGHQQLDEWGQEVTDLSTDSSSGARTARAVGIMQGLDTELRQGTKDKFSLDDVARRLSRDKQPVTLERLRQVSQKLLGKPAKSLEDLQIPSR